MHLTERSLVAGAACAGLEVAGLWLEEPGLRRLAAFLVLVVLGALIAEARRQRERRPQLTLAVAPVELGRPAEVSLLARNPTAAPLCFEYLPALPRTTSGPTLPRTLVIPPLSVAQDRYSLEPHRLGHHRLPATAARVLGRFGLGWWPCELAADAVLTVRPGFLSDDERRRATATGGDVVLAATGVGCELIQLRPYRVGDPPRSIDWRATARTGALISREFGIDQHLEVLLLIDAGRHSRLGIDGNDRLGHYAHVAARLAERAVLADDRVGLLVFADRILVRLAPARGVAALNAVRAALTDVVAAGAESDLVGAALAARKLARVRSLVVLFSDLDDPRGSGQLGRAVALLSPRHQVLVAGLQSAAIAELARVRPPRRAQAYAGLAADVSADAMSDTVSRLRLSGVPAILAAPSGYERAVFAAYDTLRARGRV